MDSLLLISFAGGIVWSIVCYQLAKGKNRNTGAAAVTGFLFGIFAVIYYLCVGKRHDS
jgi:hypothetical protein